MTVTLVEAGSLKLPDGRIVAADPFAAADAPAPARRAEPGEYAVLLSLVRYGDSPYDTIAAAMLRFAGATPVAWYLALHSDVLPVPLEPGEIHGYPVDSGNGAFMSPEGPACSATSSISWVCSM